MPRYEVYTIGVLIDNQVFPCLFGLLLNKVTGNNYACLLQKVWSAIQNVGSDTIDILLDFERLPSMRFGFKCLKCKEIF